MNPLDNVERRDSDPQAHTNLVAPNHDTTELYERHLNAVCRAIRQTPCGFVDEKFATQVLNTLANRAHGQGNFAETLDLMADQFEDLGAPDKR